MDRALHVGHLFRPLVDEKHDQHHLRVVGGDAVGDVLEEHRLPRTGGGHDETALSLSDRGHEVHDPGGEVVLGGLEPDPVLGIERRQVVEEDPLPRCLRGLEVDRLHLDESEIPLALFRRANLAGDGVAGSEIELADLRRRDVDVVRSREIVVLGRAEESESVGQTLENAFGEDETALLRLGLQDLEDQLLLPHAGRAGDAQVLGDFREGGDVHLLELGDVERLGLGLAAGDLFGYFLGARLGSRT